MTMLATAAPAALAGGTGGASAGPTVAPESSASTSQPPPRAPLHTAPVTARSPRLTYAGPVYERTASGEIIPYRPPLAAGQLNPGTGGSPVGVTASSKPQLLVPGSLARYVHGLGAAPIS